jgi:cold shock CspA family protein
MKLLFVVFASALALSAQDQPADPAVKEPAKKAAPKATDAAKPAIPAEAVLGADGNYHYTDPQGKKWIYRKTAFGVSHMEDTPQPASAKTSAANGAGITATEDGDKVRFERRGPFGVWRWEKKKSELDEGEKAALANSQASKNVSEQN